MKIFIPIKHNSQRVPNKNFRNINGVPLWKHTLYKLQNHEVYVDTDSDDIIGQISLDDKIYNTEVYKRDPWLLGDQVSVCDLIQDFILQYEPNDYICQLHVTSPFLNNDILYDAFQKLEEGYDSVVSCNKIQTRFWRKEDYGYTPVNHNPLKLEQTQDLPPYYEENSLFYIFKANDFKKTHMRIGKNPFFYEVRFPYNVDIDTEDDWNLVEALSK